MILFAKFETYFAVYVKVTNHKKINISMCQRLTEEDDDDDDEEEEIPCVA